MTADSFTKKESFDDKLEKWTIKYYSFNRERRYKRAAKQLANYIARIWESRYLEDNRYEEFTLTYFVSERRRSFLIPSDFALTLFTHGFNDSEKIKAINLLERMSWLRYQMHPADAYHKQITPEEEMRMLYDIVGAMPEDQLRLYDFKVVDLPVIPADYEMQPDRHWMKCFVFTRKDAKNYS